MESRDLYYNIKASLGDKQFKQLLKTAEGADIVSKIETGATTKVIEQNTAVTLTSSTDATQGNGTMYFNIFYRVLNVGSSF